MPLDATRWQIEIAAADRTAQAFSSVNRRMKALQSQSVAVPQAMSAGFASITRMLGPLAAGLSAADQRSTPRSPRSDVVDDAIRSGPHQRPAPVTRFTEVGTLF